MGTGPPVLRGESHTCQNTVTSTSLQPRHGRHQVHILRPQGQGRGRQDPPRVRRTAVFDDRVVAPWTDPAPWTALKPSMPWGQMPQLTYKGEKICQSMTICRFLAREIGIAGRNSLEMAQVDEIVNVIQDAVDATYKAWNAANRSEELVKLTTQTFPTVLGQLEKRLSQRGHFFVGNTLTWADIHLFFFCGTGDFMDSKILRDFPMLNYLVARVGAIPNIKKWMETRPPNGAPQKDFMIFFKNAHRILAENPMSCL